MKDFLSIGEISRLFGLNIQTLYYYDSIGLFSPKYRDPATGRRKYEFDQVYPLATICYMKRLGYSLQDIKEQMNTQHVGEKLDSLKRRSDELHRQWQELISVDEAIQRKIRFIEQAMQNIRVDQISIRSYGTRRSCCTATAHSTSIRQLHFMRKTGSTSGRIWIRMRRRFRISSRRIRSGRFRREIFSAATIWEATRRRGIRLSVSAGRTRS